MYLSVLKPYFMKLTHRKIRFLTRLLLVVAVFAQGTLAAHACVSHEVSAVKALSQVSAESCHHTESVSTNECLMHCTQAEQVNIDHHTLEIVNTSTAVLLVARLDMQNNLHTCIEDSTVIDTGPPLAIRFCTFLL